MAHGSKWNPHARARAAFSLLELIVVLGILAVLCGLLLVAVASSRRTAVHLSSVNNLRQITLATLQYNDVQDPTLLAPANYPEGRGWTSGVSLFELILPHLDVNTANIADPLENPPRVVKIYSSPADPSLNYKPFFERVGQKCSYAVNISTLVNGLNVPFGIPDGTSSTIAFSESYHYSQKTEQHLLYNDIVQPVDPAKPWGTRRASFADYGWRDVMPVSDGVGHTVASVSGETFQYMPTVAEARGGTPKTPHRAGLPVAMYDGSVRTLRPGISETVFWALVTHDGGEVIGDY